ncbi:hypothetical protein BHE74_00012679 [Ensete ventricosum]|nr:hypothetical protein BHE74_00012679 [Ensete ventricosum]RZR91441.1 hypothetical protein BHM03_00019555 [Ensete ventricosum]
MRRTGAKSTYEGSERFKKALLIEINAKPNLRVDRVESDRTCGRIHGCGGCGCGGTKGHGRERRRRAEGTQEQPFGSFRGESTHLKVSGPHTLILGSASLL